MNIYIYIYICTYVLSWNFSEWFTIDKGDKLLISTLLHTTIARTTPSVFLIFGWTILYFGMSLNHKRTMTHIFEQAENELPSNFLSSRLVSVHVEHPYSSIDMTAAWKKLHFISSVRSDFCMTDSVPIAVHDFANQVLMSVSVDETLLPS